MNFLADGQKVQVDIARTLFDATVVNGPLYDPDGAIMELADMPYMTWFIRLMNLFN